jgi:hypothetical protein
LRVSGEFERRDDPPARDRAQYTRAPPLVPAALSSDAHGRAGLRGRLALRDGVLCGSIRLVMDDRRDATIEGTFEAWVTRVGGEARSPRGVFAGAYARRGPRG